MFAKSLSSSPLVAQCRDSSAPKTAFDYSPREAFFDFRFPLHSFERTRASIDSSAYGAAPHIGLHENRDTLYQFWRYCDNSPGLEAIEQRTLGVCLLAIL
ncbi:hypothetical protein N7457_002797 [Penicillium paradoxum]|uniref:uncharacterized protein n=1 Tax=Penicillium paradoxum TaxID=176176 RepID=UPI002547F120|nr:uncharacterized protein N7457_002797 [Penicillium paradoxum]KAJ5787807.1 hypothetical protein N7457_002797 [Penicillium paradoxum]